MNVKASLEALINAGRHYHRPRGIIGRLAGRNMARQHRPENEWSVALLAPQPTDRVLEVGFGPGVAIQLLAAQVNVGLVAGVDYSPTMVAQARRRNAQAIKNGRVDLRDGEATKLPFADASFDKVLSIHTLYFWSQPMDALTELRRVLKPGGTLTLTFMPREYWPSGETAEHIDGVYTGPEVAQLMLEAGFSQARVELGPMPKPFREIAVVATK